VLRVQVQRMSLSEMLLCFSGPKSDLWPCTATPDYDAKPYAPFLALGVRNPYLAFMCEEEDYSNMYREMRKSSVQWFFIPFITNHCQWLQCLDLGPHSAWMLDFLESNPPAVTFPALRVLELAQPAPSHAGDPLFVSPLWGDSEAHMLDYTCFDGEGECNCPQARWTRPVFEESMARLRRIVTAMLRLAPRLEVVSPSPTTCHAPFIHYIIVFLYLMPINLMQVVYRPRTDQFMRYYTPYPPEVAFALLVREQHATRMQHRFPSPWRLTALREVPSGECACAVRMCDVWGDCSHKGLLVFHRRALTHVEQTIHYWSQHFRWPTASHPPLY